MMDDGLLDKKQLQKDGNSIRNHLLLLRRYFLRIMPRRRRSPVAPSSLSAGAAEPQITVPRPEKDMSINAATGQQLLPISPEHASTRYPDVGSLLSALNDVFRTQVPITYPGLEKTLDHLKDEYDFGNIYARLRMIWPPKQRSKSPSSLWDEFSELIQELITRSTKLEEERRNCLVVKAGLPIIRNPHLVQTRRIWDLYAHRVVPFEFIPERLKKHYYAVSHSWTTSMPTVDTDVNGHEWPVPLPAGITLELVRRQLLEKHAQFVWLDVVCLRQKMEDKKHPKYEEREKQRAEEWKIDIPTIGNLYNRCRYVVRYFNGLGVPFSREGWTHETHWSQRAWTLQEVGTGNSQYINMGLPRGGLSITSTDTETSITLEEHLKNPTEEVKPRRSSMFDLNELREHRPAPLIRGDGKASVVEAIYAMKARRARNPVDKVAGLALLLGCSTLPVYLENEGPESAWKRLIKQMDGHKRMELLCVFPLRGDAGSYWHPSWAQLMSPSTRPLKVFPLSGDLLIDKDCVRFNRAMVFEGCHLPAMRTSDTWHLETGRWGTETFHIYSGGQEIEKGEYIVVTDISQRCGVVCKWGKSSRLEKVSVIELHEIWNEDIKWKYETKNVVFC